MEQEFPLELESMLAGLARLFASEGKAREVALLANAQAQARQVGYDNWDGGIYYYSLHLEVPTWLYSQIAESRESCETEILKRSQFLLRPYAGYILSVVYLTPSLKADKDWRDKAKAWLAGEGVSNQGRVRSDNIPSRTCDGLLFRSQPEICLYQALKSLGVSFAPLPVFIRGGDGYRRIEPDFVILKDGIVTVVEVDGDTVHHETPAEAHVRLTMLAHEGANVERVKASECETLELAVVCAKKILQSIEKHRLNR